MGNYDVSGMTPVDDEPVGRAVAYAEPAEEAFDSLALLRDAVADKVEIEPITIPVPNVGVRLVCGTDVTSRQLKKWQEGAVPLVKRKSGKYTESDVDPMHLAVATLVGTLLRIEVADPRNKGEWLPVIDSRTGEALSFSDMPVLKMFGAMDTVSALKRLFGRDSGVVRAGRAVLRASGWSEDELAVDPEDDGSDPI